MRKIKLLIPIKNSNDQKLASYTETNIGKIWERHEIHAIVQEHAFCLGWNWGAHQIDRNDPHSYSDGRVIKHKDSPALFFTEKGKIKFCDDLDKYNSFTDYEELNWKEFINITCAE